MARKFHKVRGLPAKSKKQPGVAARKSMECPVGWATSKMLFLLMNLQAWVGYDRPRVGLRPSERPVQ
jgi:hypothetical protein